MKPHWMERPEGGSTLGLRLIRNFALLCGRRAARLLLYPITLYYLIRRGPERRASRAYLARVNGRPATLLEVARHFHCFAATILDRVFLLSERFKRFDIRHHGLDDLRNAWKQQHGVLVFGSHLGSFDALRVFAQLREDVKIRVVIDVDQNPAIFSALSVHQRPAGRCNDRTRHQGSAGSEIAGHTAHRSRATRQPDCRSRLPR